MKALFPTSFITPTASLSALSMHVLDISNEHSAQIMMAAYERVGGIPWRWVTYTQA
jgi:hypothetical protein